MKFIDYLNSFICVNHRLFIISIYNTRIKRFYKKPSNKKRIEDDLMEKKILSYLEQFTQVKEVDVETKKLRENENVN